MKKSLFILVLGCFSVVWSQGEKDFQIDFPSQNAVIVDFSPTQFQLDTLVIDNRSYIHADFYMASFSDQPGEPSVPCRLMVVGIPLNGEVRISVESSEFEEMQNCRLVSVPELQRKEGLPLENYYENEHYREQRYLPGSLVETEDPGYVGAQRIVRIKLYPLQFNPMENRIRFYRKIVLRIDFDGAVDREGFWQETENEEIYRHLLINYDQARHWRIKREQPLRKPGSIFEMGEKYKIPVSQEGIYKVTGNFLSGHGIDIGSIETSTLKIFNNGGHVLPRNMSDSRPDSLIENPILLVGMDDGRFDSYDYFLFYGIGVTGWEYDAEEDRFNHYINPYTTENLYWLVFNDDKEGRRIPTVSSITDPHAQTIDSYRDYVFLEQELYNHLKGGIHWGGQLFTTSAQEGSYDVVLYDPVPNDTLYFRFRFMGAGDGINTFQIDFNDQVIGTVNFSGSSQIGGPLINLYSHAVDLAVATPSGTNSLSFHYAGSKQETQAYLDWYELAYRRYLKGLQGKLRFFSESETGSYDYQLSGFTSEPTVLDVTNSASIRKMDLRSVTGGWAFVDTVSSKPRSYIAFQELACLSPVGIEEDEPSDLRDPNNGADYVIITHPDFYDQALQLGDLRDDSMAVFIADIQNVYDEFSWGLFDPTAIRDFIRYAYENWTVPPSYLLLFGDGHYDYRNIQSGAGQNWIPPFEQSGLSESGSRATDDWYVYVHGNDSNMDLAVGRLPVQSADEAQIVVDKIRYYEIEPSRGDWRNLITMVGDDEKAGEGDENETTHTRSAETIAEEIIPPSFNLKKIYLTEYNEIITVEGRRKPQAHDDLLAQINRGTLLVNFIGHGNSSLWAHERVFSRQSSLPYLDNPDALPLFYAATCAFALYDNPEEQSCSEDLLNGGGRGAIAVIAASRFCSSGPNEALNKTFMEELFTGQGRTLRLGDALRLAKLNVSSKTNNEMYHLLGDPAMRLGIPRYQAVFTKMEPDTFQALAVVQVEGYIENGGVMWNGFQGKMGLKCYDSKKDIVYTTQYGTPLPYTLPGNAIFRGETNVTNGQFQIAFIVPKDISYGGNTGRMSCYFWSQGTDGSGFRNDIEVGTSSNLIDTDGPDVHLYFTGREDFISGGMVSGEPELVADILDDKSGVNITGEIGHKMILTLDGQVKTDVTEYFQYEEGSYLGGRLIYRLSDLENGIHELSFKVWDNANNSSTQTIVFEVVSRGDLKIDDVLNYPNPFETSTHFTFKLSQGADVEIKIFTVDGQLIRVMDDILGEPGLNVIFWDGRDDVGDELANGVYLYKVIAQTYVDGKKLSKEEINRLMIMR
ncbi:type IX secretion system sortase PorU [bacterium]|nr:type IX secretion system sortase PorU [bacterium]